MVVHGKRNFGPNRTILDETLKNRKIGPRCVQNKRKSATYPRGLFQRKREVFRGHVSLWNSVRARSGILNPAVNIFDFSVGFPPHPLQWDGLAPTGLGLGSTPFGCLYYKPPNGVLEAQSNLLLTSADLGSFILRCWAFMMMQLREHV